MKISCLNLLYTIRENILPVSFMWTWRSRCNSKRMATIRTGGGHPFYWIFRPYPNTVPPSSICFSWLEGTTAIVSWAFLRLSINNWLSRMLFVTCAYPYFLANLLENRCFQSTTTPISPFRNINASTDASSIVASSELEDVVFKQHKIFFEKKFRNVDYLYQRFCRSLRSHVKLVFSICMKCVSSIPGFLSGWYSSF